MIYYINIHQNVNKLQFVVNFMNNKNKMINKIIQKLYVNKNKYVKIMI